MIRSLPIAPSREKRGRSPLAGSCHRPLRTRRPFAASSVWLRRRSPDRPTRGKIGDGVNHRDIVDITGGGKGPDLGWSRRIRHVNDAEPALFGGHIRVVADNMNGKSPA